MIGSYLFSLTLTPILSAFLFKNKLANSENKKSNFFQGFVQFLNAQYKKSLVFILRFRAITLITTIALFIFSISQITELGYELFPQSDVGQMEIQVRMESGTTLKTTQETIIVMEQEIRAEAGDDLEQIISNIGVFYDLPAAYTPNSGTQDAFIGVQLKKEHKKSIFEYANILRKQFKNKFPGVEISFNTGGLITAALNEGKPSPIDVRIKGNNLEKLRSIAEQIRDTINSLPNLRDVRVLQRIDQPSKNIDIDRIKAAELGVEPVDAIKNMVSALNSSTTFNKSFWIDERNGNHYYVGITYPENEINTEFTIENVAVGSKTSNKTIPFRNFSRFTEGTNPVEINHHNLMRTFNVYANVDGADIGHVSDKVKDLISGINLPKGYEVNFDGEVVMIQQSFSGLSLGLLLAIAFAFLIITPLFKSFRQPFIIILAFPLGLMGVIFLMKITNTYLSIQSIMGIIMMVGISVSYGNILIDRINNLIIDGQSETDAIINGSSERFRPILMTAATTIFGLLPSALSTQAGTEANVPLAIAVIGGTFMTTLLTYYVIPILYSFIAKKSQS